MGGSTCFLQISEIQDAPPHSGGEHLVISEGEQLVISGFTPQWGGVFGLRWGVGGEHFSNFRNIIFRKVHPTVGGAYMHRSRYEAA